jgi:hypothetical protein
LGPPNLRKGPPNLRFENIEPEKFGVFAETFTDSMRVSGEAGDFSGLVTRFFVLEADFWIFRPMSTDARGRVGRRWDAEVW